jgi:hypothetical protein
MAGRPTALNDHLLQEITTAIRDGAYDWVAAEAVGIHRSTFYRWLAQGEQGEQPYARFADAVLQARAEARRDAERRAFREHPLAWLRQGPGRARHDSPGWGNPPPQRRQRWDRDDEPDDPAFVAEVERSLERVRQEELAYQQRQLEQYHASSTPSATADPPLPPETPWPSASPDQPDLPEPPGYREGYESGWRAALRALGHPAAEHPAPADHANPPTTLEDPLSDSATSPGAREHWTPPLPADSAVDQTDQDAPPAPRANGRGPSPNGYRWG